MVTHLHLQQPIIETHFVMDSTNKTEGRGNKSHTQTAKITSGMWNHTQRLTHLRTHKVRPPRFLKYTIMTFLRFKSTIL